MGIKEDIMKNFVVLIFVYVIGMNAIDRKHNLREE